MADTPITPPVGSASFAGQLEVQDQGLFPTVGSMTITGIAPVDAEANVASGFFLVLAQ